MAIYLLPTFLGESTPEKNFTAYQLELLASIRIFAVEEARTARRDLRKMGYSASFEETHMYELGKHSEPDIVEQILNRHGTQSIGLLSEAGVPAVADPGNTLVRAAQNRGIRCVPLVGPSSLLLSLMASGLNGQNFAFNGYLPIEAAERRKKIRFYEKRSSQENQTQIFIETPFRNKHLISDLCGTLSDTTLLTIAADITTENESILTKPVSKWKKALPDGEKRPAVFLFLAGGKTGNQ